MRYSPVVVAFLLAPSVSAQLDASARLRPITSPVRNAGVYHLATGAWTRHAGGAGIGTDVIYDNTCPSGFFAALSGDTYVDEGRLPSDTSPAGSDSRPGCNRLYRIDGFQVAYCTDQSPSTFGTYTVNFYASYAACTSVVGVVPTASFALPGLPAGITSSGVCWIATVDLDSPPLTASLAFNMLADGDGTYAGAATSNLFGWSMTSTAPGSQTGPIIAGNPSLCSHFDGTRWDSPVNYAEAGTGMTTQDLFRVETLTLPGCYDFGASGPFASFWLEVYADACVDIDIPPSTFCAGSGGTSLNCPCGNNSPPGLEVGCLNSFGVGARLRGTGLASLTADTVVLAANNLPASSVLFFQGTVQQNGGAGSLFGDGLRCAGGPVVRLETYVATGTPGAAASSYPQAGDPSVSVRGGVTLPGVRTYQAWYRNTAAFCTPAGFNTSNGIEITWAL